MMSARLKQNTQTARGMVHDASTTKITLTYHEADHFSRAL